MVLDDPAGVEAERSAELGVGDQLAIPRGVVVAVGADGGHHETDLGRVRSHHRHPFCSSNMA
jgi:hypothetical protein